MPDIFFAGGEPGDFTVTSSNIRTTTTAGFYDSTRARCAINFNVSSLSDYIQADFAQQNEVWIHFDFLRNVILNTATRYFSAFDNTGVENFRLQPVSTSTFVPQYFNGSVWVNIGSAITSAFNSLDSYDIRIKNGVSGQVEVYINNSLRSSVAVSLTSISNIARLRFYNAANGFTTTGANYSQIAVTDFPMIGHSLYTYAVTGAGANSDLVGVPANINGIGIDDLTFVEGSVNDEVSTYTKTTRSLGIGTVKGVILSSRIRNTGSGVANMQAVLRRGSTNYPSANLTIGLGYGPAQHILMQDPSTTADWTAADWELAATQIGLRART